MTDPTFTEAQANMRYGYFDGAPGEEPDLSTAVEGAWGEAWVGYDIALVCGPLPGRPCADEEARRYNTTTLELRDHRFVATTRSHRLSSTGDTLGTESTHREGQYEVRGDTLIFMSEREAEPYTAAVVGDSLRLRDAQCDPAVEGFCALDPSAGLPWGSGYGLVKRTGTLGRE